MKKLEIINTSLLIFIVILLTYQSFQLGKIGSLLNSSVQDIPKQIQQTNKAQTNWRVDCGNSLDNYDAVFIYSPFCPHSARMKPLVENADIKFYWINPFDSRCSGMNLAQFNYSRFVPHFYCLKSHKFRIGEMSSQDFKKWVDDCKNFNTK